MQKPDKNWIVNELYDLALAAQKSGELELSEDIASVAAAYDTSPLRTERYGQFMAVLLTRLNNVQN